ncbi:MAG: DUF1616 domain-containing protein [Candidatus Thorarchaeota archaeon]
MSSKLHAKNHPELRNHYNQFDRLLRLLLIIGIIVISGFLIYYLMTPKPGYVSFGILNSEKEAGNYPVSVQIGSNVSFYLTVDNYLDRSFSFRVELLKSNETEISRPSSPLYTLSILNTSIVVLESQRGWISDQFNVSFSEVGENRSIIAELWEVSGEVPDTFFTSLYLRLNVTA